MDSRLLYHNEYGDYIYLGSLSAGRNKDQLSLTNQCNVLQARAYTEQGKGAMPPKGSAGGYAIAISLSVNACHHCMS